MDRTEIIAEIKNRLINVGMAPEIINEAGLLVRSVYSDAPVSVGSRGYIYEAIVMADEKTNTLYMWDNAAELGGKDRFLHQAMPADKIINAKDAVMQAAGQFGWIFTPVEHKQELQTLENSNASAAHTVRPAPQRGRHKNPAANAKTVFLCCAALAVIVTVVWLYKDLLSVPDTADGDPPVITDTSPDPSSGSSPVISPSLKPSALPEISFNDSSIVSEGVSRDDLGNIMNGQYYFDHGSEVFYSSFDTDGNAHIYKTSRSDGVTAPIFDGFGWSLVVVDDWLYFSGNEGAAIDNSYNLYRMKTDGTQRQKLNSGYCFNMFVYQDWLYYTKQITPGNEQYSIFRCLMDGSGETLVADDSHNAILYEKKLYYNDSNHNIYETDPDGSSPLSIVSGLAESFIIGNGRLIFFDADGNLYVSEIDGSSQTMIRPAGVNPITKINSYEDKIFITTFDGHFLDDYYAYHYWLSSLSFDGTLETEIYGGISYGTYVNIIDGSIYVMDYAIDQETEMMSAVAKRMAFNGSDITELPR